MHYYQFNIGDYVTSTQHLEPMEDLAYRRMLDLYYQKEQPLILDVEKLARLIRMRSHCECIKFVLDEFFTKEKDGFHNAGADKNLGAVYAKSSKAKASAEARWAKAKKIKKLEVCERNAIASTEQCLDDANGMLPNTYNPLPITQDTESNKDIVQKEICTKLIEQGFDIFYSAGLIKKTKKKSFDKFKTLVKSMKADPVELGELLKKDIQIRIANNQFGIDRLHPATYLNQQRWEDSHEENVNGNANQGGKPTMQERILQASGYGRHEGSQVMGGNERDIRGTVDQGTRSETLSYLDSQSEQAGRIYDQDGSEADY